MTGDDSDMLDRILKCNDEVFRAGTTRWMSELSNRVDAAFRAILILSLLGLMLSAFIIYLIWKC